MVGGGRAWPPIDGHQGHQSASEVRAITSRLQFGLCPSNFLPDLFYCCFSKTFENAISGNLETSNFQNSLTWCQAWWCLAAVVSQIMYMFPRSSTVHAVLCSTLYNLIYRKGTFDGGGGTSIKTDLRGCLYGSEPARVPELTRFPKMNFTTCLHETFGAGWLVKTNTNFAGKFEHAHKDIILLKSRVSSGKCVYMENYPACLPEVSGHTKQDLG